MSCILGNPFWNKDLQPFYKHLFDETQSSVPSISLNPVTKDAKILGKRNKSVSLNESEGNNNSATTNIEDSIEESQSSSETSSTIKKRDKKGEHKGDKINSNKINSKGPI